jgi:hypothetical protein
MRRARTTGEPGYQDLGAEMTAGGSCKAEPGVWGGSSHHPNDPCPTRSMGAQGASYHNMPRARYRVTQDWLAEHRSEIEAFYLPSYSPELNPDEDVIPIRLNLDLLQVGVAGEAS